MSRYRPRISVCIPVFNHDVVKLVNALLQEVANLPGGAVTILVLDDASTNTPIKINNKRFIEGYKNASYFENATNGGRSQSRNKLASLADGNQLLFLDCDTLPCSNNFLKTYLESASPEKVVCGGLAYQSEPSDAQFMLRWKYGVNREERPVETRLLNPWKSFSSANFMVPSSCFSEHPFEEKLTRYGHEDTLWGFALKISNYSISHVHNPVYHLGIDSSEVFLSKTEASIKNLLKTWELLNYDNRFKKDIQLLNTASELQKWHLHKTVHALLKQVTPHIRKNLTSGNPSLLLFDLFKLKVLLDTVLAKAR